MTIDKNNLVNSIMESLDRVKFPDSNDLPNVDLYMDQVTTYMDQQLAASKRHNEDKVLTKTMINNYAKNNLLPPPERKKYTKEHLLTMIFIYYFKSIMSITDIQSILTPITDTYFNRPDGLSLTDIYDELTELSLKELDSLKADILKKFVLSSDAFPDLPTENEDFLQTFTMICLLSFDIYIKKLLVENLIDTLSQEDLEPEKKGKKDVKRSANTKSNSKSKSTVNTKSTAKAKTTASTKSTAKAKNIAKSKATPSAKTTSTAKSIPKSNATPNTKATSKTKPKI